MNTILWVIQGILAAVFMMTGAMKLFQKKEALVEKMGFVEDFSEE